MRSDQGYSVMRCTTNGIPTEPARYIAFCHRPNIKLHEHVLGGYDSADFAKAACEAHLAKLEEPA